MEKSLNDFEKRRPADRPDETPTHPYDPQHYARTRFAVFPDDFSELENPTNRTLTAVVFLGDPPRGSEPRPPASRDHDDDDEPVDERVRRWAHRKIRAQRCKIVFEPKEKKLIPNDLIRGLVLVRDGVVVGGLMHHLRLVGDPNPPTIHEALMGEPADEPFETPRAAKPAKTAKAKEPTT